MTAAEMPLAAGVLPGGETLLAAGLGLATDLTTAAD